MPKNRHAEETLKKSLHSAKLYNSFEGEENFFITSFLQRNEVFLCFDGAKAADNYAPLSINPEQIADGDASNGLFSGGEKCRN